MVCATGHKVRANACLDVAMADLSNSGMATNSNSSTPQAADSSAGANSLAMDPHVRDQEKDKKVVCGQTLVNFDEDQKAILGDVTMKDRDEDEDDDETPPCVCILKFSSCSFLRTTISGRVFYVVWDF